jgi:glycosyltransferase involved in cell wall biosynthesis
VNSPAALHVAIATPWFGSDLTGGAERTAWQLATGLAGRGHRIDVFATCSRSFAADWGSDVHPAGSHAEYGLTIHRFPVDARRADAFDRANEVMLSRPLSYYRDTSRCIEAEIEDAFVSDGINSTAAIEALRAQLDRFDAVIVMPYLYGFVLAAIDAVGPRSILVPCLHDEPYAYLPSVERAFRRAGVVMFNTAAERRLATALYGPAVSLKARLGGQWVDAAAGPDPTGYIPGFRTADRHYVLYLGRRDATKNVDALLESFATFRRRNRLSNLELVLVGPGRRSYDDSRHGIRDLGFVDDRQKAVLVRDAWAVAQPSVNESFSRVIVEAWSAGSPVIVSARCAATADAVRESGGGWTAATKAEWSSTFELVDMLTPERRTEIAASGRRYVEDQTSRERILDRYEAAIRALRDGVPPSRFDVPASAALVRRLHDGRRTIVFAGPLVERSCIEQLLAGFAFLLSFRIDARLVLVGDFDPAEALAERFFSLVAQAHLADRVVVITAPEPGVLGACYRSADLFWSTSEDGPERELVDALGYGVPVFAFANPVAERVLGDAGILFERKDDMRTLGGVAAMLLTDASLHHLVEEAQQRRFESLRLAPEPAHVG